MRPKILALSGFLVCVAMTQAQAVPIVYSGSDAGAASFAAMTNSQAAAAAFDAATGPLSIIDFESALPGGVSITGGSTTNTSSGFALFGDNTTIGGDYYRHYDGSNTLVTFNFATPISAFGAYLTGLQGDVVGQQTISYTDGNTETINIPKLPGASGGGAFVGFQDVGASISAVSFTLFNDIVGIDDVRYGDAVPEPSSLALLGLGVLGVVGVRRRRRRHTS